MAIRVFVDDVDISQGSAWVSRDGWSITNYAFDAINFARFVVMDPALSFSPSRNAGVRIVDDSGNVLFGGTISRRRAAAFQTDDGYGRRWTLEAHGWTLRLQRKDVSGVYTGRTDAQIIAAEVSDTPSGSPPGIIYQVNATTRFKFSAGVVEASSVSHGVVPLEYSKAAGAIDDLAAAAGFVWWVDHDRRIHYRAQHNIPESVHAFRDHPTTAAEECYDLVSDEDTSGIINEVLVIADYGTSDTGPVEFSITAGDIQTGAVSLLYYWNPTYTDNVLNTKFERNTETDATKPPAWEKITVVLNEDTDGTADGVWHVERQLLEFKPGTFTPAAAALRVTGERLTLGLVSVRDEPAIDALGGEVFREVVNDPSLVSRARIEGLAQGLLNRNRNASFGVSLVADRFVAPAERVRVVSEALEIDEVLLVEQVDIEPDGATTERYRVQLVRLAPPIV